MAGECSAERGSYHRAQPSCAGLGNAVQGRAGNGRAG